MKKLLLFLSVFVLMFTLSACDETAILDSITSVEGSITDVEADITALQTSLTAAEANVSTLQSDVDMVEGDVTTLGTTLDGLDDDIEDIESDITDLQSQIDALDVAGNTAEILLLQTAISDLETALAALDVRVGLLETALTALEVRVGLLETDVQMLMKPDVTVDYWKDMMTTEIVLMYNNDVHGRVNDDSWAGSIGYATIKNMVDEIRANYDHTYLVSAGDMVHGTTFATLEEGESFIEVMNAVGYDLMVPGNHDFDYGQDQLLVLEGLANFPLISSNIQYDADDTDMFDTYYVETFGDVEVGFFGLTTPDTTYMTHPDNVIGLNFLDPIAQAEAMVTMLEAEGVDIIVCLGHIGLDENDSITSEDIALAVDGIDVFVDGHSHSYLPEGYMVNETLIISTGEYNKNFGVLELVVEDGAIIDYTNVLIHADEAEMLGLGENAEVQAIIDAIAEDQEAILNIVVGQTAVELDGVRDNVRTGETNLAQIITDSMVIVSGADIAITNGGGIRESIPVGDVTRGHVIEVLPFGNIIVTVDLTGQEIIDTLEYASSALPGSSGKFPHVSGVTYTINLNNAEGSRVESVMINGVAVDVNMTYSVATNDFMAAGGDGYEILGAATVTGEYMGLHEALESMFTVGVDIVIPVDVRLTVIEETVD